MSLSRWNGTQPIHSRESIEITHNRVKRSRLYLNAFMCTLRRANAISAPRKSATREFCKHDFKMEDRRTPERDEEEFERDDDEQRERERERERREKQKEKEGETLGVLSLFFFLPVVSFFANTRDDREQSRTFYVSTQLLVLVLVLVSSSSRLRLSRACSEKKKKL